MTRSSRCVVFTGLILFFVHVPPPAHAAPVSGLDESGATTELKCSFGMGQGEAKQSCAIPVPEGCRVVHLPGTTKPWASLSKAGNTQCKFDEKASDWKTRITGTCSRCKTGHCSALFSVRSDCSGR